MKFSLIISLFVLLSGLMTPSQAQISLSLPVMEAVDGDTVIVNIALGQDVTGEDIFGYRLQFSYNSSLIEPMNVITSGTTSEGWSVTSNTETPGTLILGGASASAMVGEGTLVQIRFKTLSSGFSVFSWNTSETYFNEGDPEVSLTNGNINVTAKPTIFLSPNTATLAAGDQLQFSVFSAEAPVTWQVNDSDLAEISSTGLLTALGRGEVQVTATDNRGISVTSGSITIRGFRLMVENINQFRNLPVSIPVTTTDLSALGITSGEIRMNSSFFSSGLTLSGISTDGTLISSDALIDASLSGNELTVAFAQNTPITGNGILMYVNLVMPDVPSTSFYSVSFSKILFEEEFLGLAQTFNVQVTAPSPLGVTPFSVQLFSSEQQQFNVAGAIGPVSWSINNPALASINENGLFTALKGGIVQVSVTDSIGASGNSSNINIFDTRVKVADSTIVLTEELLVPVRAYNIDGNPTDIYGLQGRINYDPNILELIAVERNGSLTENWTFSSDEGSGFVQFAAASGSTPIDNDGVIFYLKFTTNPAVSFNTSTSISIANWMFNEGEVNALLQNGAISLSINPATPVLKSPESGTVNTELENVLLTWNPASGAQSYELQVAVNGAYDTSIISETDITTTNYNANGLAEGITYYWRVRAVGPSGTGDWSSSFIFTTKPPVPASPTLFSPGDEAVNTDTTVVFSWSGISFASGYRFELAEDDAFTSIVRDISQTGTSLQVYTLDFDQTYYWRVFATNFSGEGPPSVVRSFTTRDGLPPAVVLSLPSNGSIGLELPITFEWQSISDVTGYQFQIGSEGAFDLIEVDRLQSEITTLVTELEPLTTYPWRVRGENAQGFGPWSATRTFATATIPPVAPVLMSPANLASDLDTLVIFEWEASSFATSYVIELSEADDFASITRSETLAETSVSIGGLGFEMVWYWRVRAVNEKGESDNSTVRSFTTREQGQLAIPQLISPADAATAIPLDVELSWLEVPEATVYSVIVAENADLTGVITDESTSEHSILAGNIGYSKTYWWRVRASDSIRESLSEIRSFTTRDAPFVGIPELVSPSDTSEEIDPLLVTLQWNAASQADYYEVHLSMLSDFETERSEWITEDLSVNAEYLQYDQSYFWRVRAGNDEITSEWSVVWSFTTKSAPIVLPGNVTLSAPENGTENVSVTPKFYWGSADFATSYTLQVATDSVFATFVINEPGVEKVEFDSNPVIQLEWEMIHYWRVRGENINGTGEWSSVWSFTTLSEPQPPVFLTNFPLSVEISAGSLYSFRLDSTVTDPDNSFTELTVDIQAPDVSNFDVVYNTETSLVNIQTSAAGTFEITFKVTDPDGLEAIAVMELIIQTGVSTEGGVNGIPQKVLLLQNYPNPFNPSTLIQYQLPVTSNVRLEVYDLLGRKVATLVNGIVPSGYHTATFDGSGISSGIYIYRLQTGHHVMIKQMMLLK